jgi:hypothetical protein
MKIRADEKDYAAGYRTRCTYALFRTREHFQILT